MPYISKKRREELLPKDPDYRLGFPVTSGELNFVITDEILNYYHNNGKHYRTINDILGAIEGAKLEFYRRVVVPYEDQKILENGDVYD